jgi:anti-anti-sigma regulatory factor
MELTLQPLKKDNLIRIRCGGQVSHRDKSDPFQTLLGPECYGHVVLLSLERSQTIDTSGLAWLFRAHNNFTAAGGKLVLYGVPPVILDLLNFARLTSQLHIAQSEQDGSAMAVSVNGKPSGDGRPALPGR